MSAPLKLRDYQEESVDAIFDYFDRRDGNPLVVIPTGGGKSLVLASAIAQMFDIDPTCRVVVATHNKELVVQNSLELCAFFPSLTRHVGINSAGVGKRQTDARILFCGIQSSAKYSAEIGHVDVLFVDEAHMIPDAGDGQYRRFIAALTTINPHLRVVGLTATPYRTGTGLLCGKGKIFSSVCYSVDVTTLIDAGYLSPLVSKECKEQSYDLAGVDIVKGEYVAKQLRERIDACEEMTAAAVKKCIDTVDSAREKWMFFCASVKQAELVTELLLSHGRQVELVTGETPKKERDSIVARMKISGSDVDTLVNVGVFTTGFNVPAISFIGLLRPTQSVGLYVQILGRGMRIHPGKEDCLVLDFGGNLARHGPINKIEILEKVASEKKGNAPTKTCEMCFAEMATSVRVCAECGFKFPERSGDVEDTAATGDFIARDRPQWVDITEVRVQTHSKKGKPDSVRIDYVSGSVVASTRYICPFHDGFAAQKANTWIERNVNRLDEMSIENADELRRHMMAKGFRIPGKIYINMSNKWPEIMRESSDSKYAVVLKTNATFGMMAVQNQAWLDARNEGLNVF